MSSHTELSAALGALAQLCQTRFQIALSLPQLITNTEYLDSVLAELAAVDDAPLQTLLAEIRQLRVAPTVQAAADVKATAIAEKKPALKLAVVSLALAGLLGAALWYFSAVVSETTPIVVAQPNSAASTATPVAPEQSQKTAAVMPAAAPQLRIHGSNTVGEKLAPVLIEAFLAQQGGAEFSWQQQNAEVERLLSFSDSGQHKQVQLHAHGSSTAFKDLANGTADVGMSSRRITADEVRNLAHRTQESAEEIHKMITSLQIGSREAVTTMNASQASSEQSVEVANQAGLRLVSVTQRIGEIDGMNQSVAAATEEQTAVVETLNVDVNQINLLNQQGVANLNETLKDCDALSQQASRLKQLVDSFKI